LLLWTTSQAREPPWAENRRYKQLVALISLLYRLCHLNNRVEVWPEQVAVSLIESGEVFVLNLP